MPRTGRDVSPSAASIQRQAVERLKTTLFGVDPYVRRPYILDFHREFRACRRVVRPQDLVMAGYRSDAVFIGDYHALPSCQEFAGRFLEEMAMRRTRVILAVEMVFGRHQRVLDRYMRGEIADAEFLRRIRYEQDWGYPWMGYRELFETARRLGVPVVAADAEPRGGLTTIRRRDAHAGRRIASLFASVPRPQVIVLFGESHLARGHLPAEVSRSLKRLGIECRSIVIVQNVESIYWHLAEKGLEGTQVVQIADGKYCVFNASPLAKYEAYRQTLDRWRGEVYDDGRPDLTPTVHHMIDTILGFLGIDPYRHRLPAGGAAADFLVDAYPDVFPVEDGDELVSILRGEGLSERQAALEAREMGRKGTRYVSAVNALFIRSFDLVAGAEEATRFIYRALSRRTAPKVPPRRLAEEDLAAASVLEEALGFLGSKVVDPARRAERPAGDLDLPTASGRPATLEGTGSRGEGQALGHHLYEAYHAGRLGRPEIAALFRRNLQRAGAASDLLAGLRDSLRGPGRRRKEARGRGKRRRK